MRTIILIGIVAAGFVVTSCGPSDAEVAAMNARVTADSLSALAAMEQTYMVDPSASKVTWSGTMVGVYTHTGTLDIIEGAITTRGGLLTGGSFVADMATILPTDDNYSASVNTKESLVEHLGGAEFFDVAGHPKAMLKITGVAGTTATVELTIRGRTNTETITDIVMRAAVDGRLNASGNLKFDRQKYGVAWEPDMKDAVLEDTIELTVTLVAEAQ